jgi:hypothetical protein
MTSCTLTSLVSSLSALMVSPAESFLGFLLTRQITPKSKDRLHTLTAGSHSIRTLLASIKFLAQCPCPRCLIPKIKIGDLGSKADRRWREKHIREDGHRIWAIIRQVREWLYVKGTNITSIFVKRMLAPESLVPSTVCCTYYVLFALLIY